MKAPIILAGLLCCLSFARSQSTGDVIKQSAGEGVKQGAATATQQTANNLSNRLMDKLFAKKNKKAKDSAVRAAGVGAGGVGAGGAGGTGGAGAGGAGAAGAGAGVGGNSAKGSDWASYSKYDFEPGDKILAVEDFNQDAVGDFPDKWNTNSTGEVQTIGGQEGKWLGLTKRGICLPEFINNLPDNFTLQFDLACNPNFTYGSGNFYLEIEPLANPGKDFTRLGFGAARNGVQVYFQANAAFSHGQTGVRVFSDDVQTMSNQVDETDWASAVAQHNIVKVSVWRQKQRLRVYLNQDKVWDLPRAFQSDKKYTTILFGLDNDMLNGDRVLFSNVRLAVGAADTRNKLVTEGKFSTTGILFDVNSAVVKPESAGVLKDIAEVLQGDPALKVVIVGHTDSDGDGSANMALSKKRAEAVKDALVKQYQIDAARLQTDGKGATQPVAANSTATGKAQNRRVEFIKTAG
ncbi:MAG TPA: OmpA family protein [Puia sp.]|nr:OmpA family protein [Puia sp.]